MNSLKALAVETQVVTKGKVTASVVEKGKVVSEVKVDIFSELAGKLKEIKVDEGDRVTKGQLIAVIDTTDLEARIAQLEGEYKAVQGMERVSPADNNQIKQQQLAVDQARISFEQAELDLDRTRQLFAAEAVTAQELEQAKAGLESARKTLAQAEVALAMAKQQNQGNKLQYQGQRESVQAQLKQLREQKTKASIVAQVEGVVFTKLVETGDFVNPGNKLFSLGPIGKMKIETYLNSKDMAYVGEGNEVGVVFKLPGKEIKLAGKISKIAPVTGD
ncbi:MAG: HlyD family secretion protein [Carboxydocellales bacterium]